MRNKKVLFLTQAAVIAAIYVVLTIFISAFNLASGAIQVRISEALTILPFFTPAAIPGLAIGCLLRNLLTGAVLSIYHIEHFLRRQSWESALSAFLRLMDLQFRLPPSKRRTLPTISHWQCSPMQWRTGLQDR